MRNQRGFLALITVVIITAIVLVVAMGVSVASLYARYDATGSWDKRQAQLNARSCLQIVYKNIESADPGSYLPANVSVTIDDRDVCVIESVSYSGKNATIHVYGSAGDSFAEITAIITFLPAIHIVMWSESP